MCGSTPDVPEPEPVIEEDELRITDEEEDRRLAEARRRGTQSLQIPLASQGSGSGLTI